MRNPKSETTLNLFVVIAAVAMSSLTAVSPAHAAAGVVPERMVVSYLNSSNSYGMPTNPSTEEDQYAQNDTVIDMLIEAYGLPVASYEGLHQKFYDRIADAPSSFFELGLFNSLKITLTPGADETYWVSVLNNPQPLEDLIADPPPGFEIVNIHNFKARIITGVGLNVPLEPDEDDDGGGPAGRGVQGAACDDGSPSDEKFCPDASRTDIREQKGQWALDNQVDNVPELMGQADPNAHIRMMEGWEAWATLTDADGSPLPAHEVIVAVIDSGVKAAYPSGTADRDRFDHEDLVGKVRTDLSWDFIDSYLDGYPCDTANDADGNRREDCDGVQDSAPGDAYGHGTQMAGIIAAEKNNGMGISGVCPSCKIMALRVAYRNPELGAAYVEDAVAKAVTHAILNGADVISMSFEWKAYQDTTGDGWIFENAIEAARREGIVLIAAAGNNGIDALGSMTCDGDSTRYPAALDGVIAVGATDPFNNRLKVPMGDGPDSDTLLDDEVPLGQHAHFFTSCGGSYVDIAAPGKDIITTNLSSNFPDRTNYYGGRWGTSYAAPLVAGVAGLIKSKLPGLRAEQIEELLLNGIYAEVDGQAITGGTAFCSAEITSDCLPAPDLPLGKGILNAAGVFDTRIFPQPGLLWVDAKSESSLVYKNIQSAIDAAVPGSEIRIVQGKYENSPEFNEVIYWWKDLVIEGGYVGVNGPREDDPRKTLIGTLRDPLNPDGPMVREWTRSGRVIYTEGLSDASELRNVTVAGGKPAGDWSSGGGMLNVGSDVVVKNVIFERNETAGGGGAVANINRIVTVDDTELSIPSEPTFVNTVFHGNVARAFYGSDPDFLPGGGAMLNVGSHPRIINSTFAENTAYSPTFGNASDITSMNDSHAFIVNSIVWSKGVEWGEQFPVFNIDTSDTTVRYSNVYGRGGIDGNIDEDPAYWASGTEYPNALDLDFAIEPPATVGENFCVDGGTLDGGVLASVAGPEIAYPEKDIVGRDRDGAVDMGAYEYDGLRRMGAGSYAFDKTAEQFDGGVVQVRAGRTLKLGVYVEPRPINVGTNGPDTGDLVFSGLPAGMTNRIPGIFYAPDWPQAVRELEWTPSAADTDATYDIEIKVCHGGAAYCASDTRGVFNGTIQVVENQAPFWGMANPTTVTRTVGGSVSFQIAASDSDPDDELDIRMMSPHPSGTSFDRATDTFTWNVIGAGTTYAYFSVSDGLITLNQTGCTEHGGTTECMRPALQLKLVAQSPGGTCFLAGTMITMANGEEIAIERIKMGDDVLSYDLERNEHVLGKVTQLFVHKDVHKGYYEINDMKVTEEHPLYVIDRGWVEAKNVASGDALFHLDEGEEEVTNIRFVPGENTVYNFEVDGYHNYFAQGKLVHNKAVNKYKQTSIWSDCEYNNPDCR